MIKIDLGNGKIKLTAINGIIDKTDFTHHIYSEAIVDKNKVDNFIEAQPLN